MEGTPRAVTGPIPVITATTEGEHDKVPDPRSNKWAAVIALALGMFTLVTVEQLPIGILTLVSDDLGVSRGSVGLTVTLPGILAGVVAILVPGATAPLNRKSVLLGSLIMVIVSCAVSAFAHTYELLLVSRVLTGIAIGMYWPVMPRVVTSQVKGDRMASALTLAYAGIGSALVLGLPLATWLGTWLGWRGSFAATGALAAITAVVIAVLVRPVESSTPETVRSTFAAARIRGVRYAFILTLIIVTAQFISYSYISPILQDIGNVPVEKTGTFLLAYGFLGIMGNFAAGPLIKRSAAIAVLVLATGVALAMILIGFVMSAPANAIIIVGVWGLFGGMASVSIQALVHEEAGDRVEAGTALNSAAYNVSIGMGAVLGGVLVDTSGLYSAVWVSAAAMVVAALIMARFLTLQHRRPSRL